MKEKILKHVAKLKRVKSKMAYLEQWINNLEHDQERMTMLMHYPNPVYQGKPVDYERIENLYLDKVDLKEFLQTFYPVVESSETVVSDDSISSHISDDMPF